MMRERIRVVGLVVALAAVTLTGCGSSRSSSSTTRSSTATTSATAQTQTTPPASSGAAAGAATGSAAVTTGPVRGRLTAHDHAPVANRPWPYAVVVRDAHGRPLTGTVDIEFVFAGVVVGRDTPPTHPLRAGRWHDSLTFPARALGQPLTFRAVAHTALGSITLDWPVKVRQ